MSRNRPQNVRQTAEDSPPVIWIGVGIVLIAAAVDIGAKFA